MQGKAFALCDVIVQWDRRRTGSFGGGSSVRWGPALATLPSHPFQIDDLEVLASDLLPCRVDEAAAAQSRLFVVEQRTDHAARPRPAGEECLAAAGLDPEPIAGAVQHRGRQPCGLGLALDLHLG